MNMNLWNLLEDVKKNCTFIELSHVVSPETPHWSGFPNMKDIAFYSYENDGFYSNEYHMVSQYGTHVDAPCHFVIGGRSVDEIGAEEMILPLCVVDITGKVFDDEDYAASVRDIREWELEHGKIPAGAFVALRTDWSKREDMDNCDEEGDKHYPGWDLDTLKFLVEERDVAAIGHETSDTDPAVMGAGEGFLAEDYILRQDRFQVELLRNLDLVPPTGALIVCSFPMIKGGSGSTARCFAICKND